MGNSMIVEIDNEKIILDKSEFKELLEIKFRYHQICNIIENESEIGLNANFATICELVKLGLLTVQSNTCIKQLLNK